MEEAEDFRRRRLRTDLSAPPPGLDVAELGIALSDFSEEEDILGVGGLSADFSTPDFCEDVCFGVVGQSSDASKAEGAFSRGERYGEMLPSSSEL